jgi:hypothetical protein
MSDRISNGNVIPYHLVYCCSVVVTTSLLFSYCYDISRERERAREAKTQSSRMPSATSLSSPILPLRIAVDVGGDGFGLSERAARLYL